jgi:hypothetical protein
VNRRRDPKESNLDIIPDDVMSLWKGSGSTESSQGSSAPAPPAKTQEKLWWYVMLFVLFSAVAESISPAADATLVYLARREALSTIFTVDHADFETYRIEGRRRFRVLPAQRP